MRNSSQPASQQNPTDAKPYKTAAPLIINIDHPAIDALHARMNELIQNPIEVNPSTEKS